MNNTSNTNTVPTSKSGLVTDLNSSYHKEGVYTYARNVIRNSKEGDMGTIGNEPSNELLYSAPYDICGLIELPDNKQLVFSGDGINSEIGIGDPKLKTYTRLYTNKCLNFSTKNPPIRGVAKKLFGKGTVVTFTDGVNPIRRIDLSKVSQIKSCDDILLFKKINQPCINVKRDTIGTIPNGSYSIAIAYSIDGTIFTDWYSITNRIILYSENNLNSLEIDVSNIDSDFNEYSVCLIGNYVDPATKGATKSARIIGRFSTSISKININDFNNSSYINIPLSNLIVKNKAWETAGIISSNSNYLLLADLKSKKEENYQLKAFSIKTEYVVKQVPVDYYDINGQDVGYYRDENYDFYIQGIYDTGDHTDRFHIPGRKKTSKDEELVSSHDVYENDIPNCEGERKIERWQVENTASEMIAINSNFNCGERLIGYGELGYFESTEKYPDNTYMFGTNANEPIRYHKFPDEEIVPRYSVINGIKYVNILGVRFKNIPKFDNPRIVGYRIIRSDRKGGNGTVVARGIMTNLRSYNDQFLKQEVYYTNYNLNDLSPDVFLSERQTSYKNGKEKNFVPLSKFYKDKFSFFSPHTSFEPRYTLGNEIKIECEEVFRLRNKFEKVYNHPKQKLLNQFAFWLSATVGSIEALMTLTGSKGKHVFNTEFKRIFGKDPGTEKNDTSSVEMQLDSVKDLVELDIKEWIIRKIKAKDITGLTKVKNIITLIASLAIKIPYSTLIAINAANETFEIINNFTGYTDYTLQLNAEAESIRSEKITRGNKRRGLINPYKYIPSDLVSIGDKLYNNYNREKTVLFELNREIVLPKTKDYSRLRVNHKNIDIVEETNGSAYYVTNKATNPNQYGRLGSSSPVSIHSCVLSGEDTPVLFGGDCVISKFSFLKKMPFFNQNLANTNFPDGTPYDYRLYRNIAYPRYWMDSTPYDFSQLLTKNVINFSNFSRTTTSKHNLDRASKDGDSISRIDNAYMYTSANCAVEFIVESDYNSYFRDKTSGLIFSKDNRNISNIFRSDNLEKREVFDINRVYSDLYTTEIFSEQQRLDFNPTTAIPEIQQNSVIYSLPSFNLQTIDNWQYFLPANYFAFNETDFGKLTSIHKLDQDRLIFLFSKSSPYISMGRDFLQLEGSGRKITVGDGGLFAQDPREVMPTDNNYGACSSRFAFSNSHLGRIFPSENQGRLLNFTEGISDIGLNGMSYWLKSYMPFKLKDYFPEYNEEENPLSSIGYQIVIDSVYETVYISKRDFVPKKDFVNSITCKDNKFYYQGREISLRSDFFQDVSWTLSYSPMEKAFVSFHDWHPDLLHQQDNHFLSVKGNGVFIHNKVFDSYCRFYDVQHPFEIEYVSTSGQTVHIPRSIEYILEVYRYKNFGRDRFHVLNENFDHLIVSNTEQLSPLLKLTKGSNNPEENLDFPRRQGNLYEISYFKEENKYRINQFWDSVRDRGEFTNNETHLFSTDESGYKSVINTAAVDLNKEELQRKKFRHYFNKFRFIKSNSGSNKFLIKLLNIKTLISIR